jgi:hypothetical protein
LEKLEEVILDPPCDLTGAPLLAMGAWDQKFVQDVSQYTKEQKPISTAQGLVIGKLISRYKNILVNHGLDDHEVQSLLLVPVYRQPPYTSQNLPREVRLASHNVLAFRFAYNAHIVDQIKKLKVRNDWLEENYPRYDRGSKVWLLQVTHGNHNQVMDLISRNRFQFNEPVEQLLFDMANPGVNTLDVTVQDNELEISVSSKDTFSQSWLRSMGFLP